MNTIVGAIDGLLAGIASTLSGFWSLVRKYPVRAQAIIVAGLGVGTAFGLKWDGTQVGSVCALSAAILGFLTEQVVTPTAGSGE